MIRLITRLLFIAAVGLGFVVPAVAEAEEDV